ncbi:MAG: hypothetical protein NVS2B15_24310 [Pseudarthrobacter sp.]
MVKPSIPSLKTRIGGGAAALLAAGAMAVIGVGAASAASTPVPSSTGAPTNQAAKTDAKTGHGSGGLEAFLRVSPDSPQATGDRAAKAATTLVGHPQLFAKLPAALQADVKTLKDAAPADRVKAAYKIKTTALSGGYGAEIQKRAANAAKAATGLAGLRQELRTAFSSGNPGAGLQQVADQLISHPKLFAKLPVGLQTDLTGLKNAAPADLDAQANKIKETAVNGGYGDRVQKMARHLEKPAT